MIETYKMLNELYDERVASGLSDVFRATVVAKVTYGAPAWSSMCTAADRDKLNTFINRCKRIGFCDKELLPSITELFGEADDILFNRTLYS